MNTGPVRSCGRGVPGRECIERFHNPRRSCRVPIFCNNNFGSITFGGSSFLALRSFEPPLYVAARRMPKDPCRAFQRGAQSPDFHGFVDLPFGAEMPAQNGYCFDI